ncbi:hypothetical protein ASF39_06795 [Methylobacterium sp. Leaf108]|nr:hypothetical protein ASF39_06795 [Methylobacterium sp. Leaf108]
MTMRINETDARTPQPSRTPARSNAAGQATVVERFTLAGADAANDPAAPRQASRAAEARARPPASTETAATSARTADAGAVPSRAALDGTRRASGTEPVGPGLVVHERRPGPIARPPVRDTDPAAASARSDAAASASSPRVGPPPVPGSTGAPVSGQAPVSTVSGEGKDIAAADEDEDKDEASTEASPTTLPLPSFFFPTPTSGVRMPAGEPDPEQGDAWPAADGETEREHDEATSGKAASPDASAHAPLLLAGPEVPAASQGDAQAPIAAGRSAAGAETAEGHAPASDAAGPAVPSNDPADASSAVPTAAASFAAELGSAAPREEVAGTPADGAPVAGVAAAGVAAAPGGPASTPSATTPHQGPPVPIGAVPMTIGLRSLSGSSQFQIRLDPIDLGRIDVTLAIDKDTGTVTTRVVVDRPETLALLQRDAGNLQQALSQAGLDAGSGIDLSLRGDGGPGGQGSGDPRSESRPGEARTRPAGADAAAQPLPDYAAPRMLRGIAGIDIRI